ncbi:lasso peptide biosynthesis B2 protein [Nostoc sp. PA-18-2419]|uniref:lasso peptide biosynthesis B2 protein n=1 Tax=Nostoc sp. PA-18-2419 TaxID=2575443 RepID=UPI00110904A4|nr:lasso peptide biosynthesis B2 protein [Nostoc sp. PA-18-2419]
MDVETAINPINVSLSWADRLKGLFTVLIAYVALRLFSLARIGKILHVFKRFCSREIGIDEANIAWAAVRKSSFFFSGRVACLELSLAFVLFALTKRLSATWCVGVAADPFRAHAWVEIDGKPFCEVDYFEKDFRRLFAV